MDFPGCLIVVSHDRYFMDKIVDHLFVFRGAGVIEDFPGNYSDFRAYEGTSNQSETGVKTSKKEWKKTDDRKKKRSYQNQQKFKKLEKEIAELEVQKAHLQNQFMEENIGSEQIKSLSLALKTLEETLDSKTNDWLELSEMMT